MEELTESSLIARASHELKTPLTIIKTHAGLLRDKQDALAGRPDRLAEVAEALAEAADRMQEKLEELLEELRSESSQAQHPGEPLDLLGLLEEEAKVLAARTGRKVSVRQEGEPGEVRGDAARLRKALGHLVDWADKRLPPGRGLALRLTWEGRGWSLGWEGGEDAAPGRTDEGDAGLRLFCALRAIRYFGGRLAE
jgi:K+-sensing histidine kinase KdpD